VQPRDEPDLYYGHPILTRADDERACDDEHERLLHGVDYDPAVEAYRA
jgi:hypothetical protein